MEIFEVSFGVKYGSISAVEVGMVPGIARRFGSLGVINKLKNPCGGRGFE